MSKITKNHNIGSTFGLACPSIATKGESGMLLQRIGRLVSIVLLLIAAGLFQVKLAHASSYEVTPSEGRELAAGPVGDEGAAQHKESSDEGMDEWNGAAVLNQEALRIAPEPSRFHLKEWAISGGAVIVLVLYLKKRRTEQNAQPRN